MAIEDRTSPVDRVAARSTIGGPPACEPMLIDRLMPCYDAVRAEHRIVPGDTATGVRCDSPRRLHPRLAAVSRRPAAVPPPAASVSARFR